MSDSFEDSRVIAAGEASRQDLAVDDPYRELMATHVLLGDLLAAGDDLSGGVEYGQLVQHLLDVGCDVEEYEDQRFAVWQSRITTGCGE